MKDAPTVIGCSELGAAPLVASLAALPDIQPEARERLCQAALSHNRAYTQEFVERHFLCPFAREGRRRGETRNEVVWLSDGGEASFVAPLLRAVKDPSVVVLQVVFPKVQVLPQQWLELAQAVTQRAHFLAGDQAFAVAALHPSLPYRTDNPYALIPLFRRAPDPTIQWVRRSVLAELERGREKGSRFIDPVHFVALLTEQRLPPSLYERVAVANHATALRLGVLQLEQQLTTLHQSAQREYQRILSAASCGPSFG